MKDASVMGIDLIKEDKKVMIKLTHDIQTLHDKSGLNKFLFCMVLENILTAFKQHLGLRKILNVTKDQRIIDYDKYKRIAGIVEGMQESDINLLMFRDEPEVWFQYYLGTYLRKKTCIICEEKDFNIVDKLKEKRSIVKVKTFDDKEAVRKAVNSLMEMYKEEQQ